METSCGVVLVNYGSILLLQYPQGHWDFPKGHVDGAETEHETAIRELFEETAIKDIDFIQNQQKNLMDIELKQLGKFLIFLNIFFSFFSP